MPLPGQVHVPSADEKDYSIEQCGDRWCLIFKSTGETLGCHDTREGAENQKRAIQAKNSSKFGFCPTGEGGGIDNSCGTGEPKSIGKEVSTASGSLNKDLINNGQAKLKANFGGEIGGVKIAKGDTIHVWKTGLKGSPSNTEGDLHIDIKAPSGPGASGIKTVPVASIRGLIDKGALQVSHFSILELSVDQMRELCAPCADKMQDRGISKLRLDTSKENLGIKEASEQLKGAIQNFGLDQTHNIRGVEIFSIGEWNGNKYSSKDLDAIVDSFRETKPYLKPYLKLGHGEDQSLLRADELPNVGKISAVYRKGDKLVADFERMPRKIYELVAAGAYDRLSCEIYEGAKINRKVYPLALKAIGILGGDTPAVENLDDIFALFAIEQEALAYGKGTKLRVHEFSASPALEEIHMADKPCEEMLENAKKEIDEYKKKAMASEVEAKKFSDEVVAIKDQIATLSKENDGLKLEKAELEKKFSEANAAISKIEGEKRQAEVETRVNSLVQAKKVLPAQAPALRALLLHAKESGVKKFSLNEKEQFDSEEALILSFVDKGGESGLPTKSETEVGNSSKLDKSDRKAFARAVETYAAKHKIGYSEAYKLLDAKPELVG